MTIRRCIFGSAYAGAFLLGSWAWLILFLPAVWAVCAYRWPYAPCWRCRGRKSNPGSTKKRFGSCKACKGSGMRQVLGSKALHKAIRGAANARKDSR